MMPVTIKNRWTKEIIATVDDADDLREAVVRLVRQGVSLVNSNLRDSNLSGSDLRGSDLSGSNLSGSNLRGSDLRDSDLRDANMSAANLSPVRDDLLAVLSFAPAEVPALLVALENGKVNGWTYSDGECGCLVGTLAMAGGADRSSQSSCSSVHGLDGQSSRPIERFFLSIKKGDTPKNSQFAKLAHQWATEWLDRMRAAFGPVENEVSQ